MREKFVKLATIFTICAMFCACAATARAKIAKPVEKQSIEDDLMASSARLKILLGETPAGSCTATVIERVNHTCRVLTAGHCVSYYDKKTSKTVAFPDMITFQVTLEEEDGKEVSYPAEVITFGEMSKSQDFAVLEAEIDKPIKLIPLADSDPKLGEEVIVANMPLSLGNQLLRGYVSKEGINEDFMIANVNRKGNVLLQINGLGIGRGSSGSAVVSIKRRVIVAMITTTIPNRQLHVSLGAMPISKFKKFYKEFKEGKHRLPKKDLNISIVPAINWIKNYLQ